MVLIRWSCVLGLALAGGALTAGCSQSLFDNHGGGGGGGGPGVDGGGPDGPAIPARCADPCIADAAADFDGTANGAGNRWRYLDDSRDRTWVPMMPMSGLLTGADPRNHITDCKANPTFAACSTLSGALLISSAGATSAADPAIEFSVPTPQVIQLTLRVFVPGDADQGIELYRNSREDVLYRGVAAVGKTVEQTIILDALAKDRFLFALAPQAKGASNVGVQLFASGTGAVFPQSCQLALEFDGATGTSIKDLCKDASFDSVTYPSTATPISLAPGPFKELGSGIDLPPGVSGDDGRFLQGTQVLDQTHDLTVQFWMMQRNQDTVSPSWPFSDLDLDAGGGLGMAIQLQAPVVPTLDVTTSLDPTPNTYIDTFETIGGQNVWQFLRVVHTGNTLSVCLDGKRLMSSTVPAGQLRTTFPPYLGKNVGWSPAGAFFDGVIADVRVVTGALPCE